MRKIYNKNLLSLYYFQLWINWDLVLVYSLCRKELYKYSYWGWDFEYFREGFG